MWMTLIIFALYKRQRDDWCNGSTATTRWYRFLIVVGGGSSPSSSPIDYFWIWLEAQRCLYAVFYSVWHLSDKTGSYLVSINILLMFLHNCCSSSVKIGCTIRICSSTVERRMGIIRRKERPTRPRYTKNENCEYNFSLKCVLVKSPGEEVIVFLLFRFVF